MISAEFNRAIMAIAPAHDVSDRVPTDPNGLSEVVAHYRDTGRLLIWSGASNHTIYGDARVNWAFRAWHDLHHITGQHDFSMAGERMACQSQIDHMFRVWPQAPRLWSRLIQAEIIDQAETGSFVTDQLSFVKGLLCT